MAHFAARAALLALALADLADLADLVDLAPDEALFNITESCADVTDTLTSPRSSAPALRERGVARELWVAWRGDVDRAAAALLLRAVAAHERCSRVRCALVLCRAPAAGNLADLEIPPAAILAGYEPPSVLGDRHARRSLGAVGGPAAFAARSFLFLDGELWPDGKPRAEGELRAVADYAPSLTRALLVAELGPLQMHASWALDAMRNFAPSTSALRAVLEREEKPQPNENGHTRSRAAVRAAAAWAADPEHANDFLRMRGGPLPNELYRLLVHACDDLPTDPLAAAIHEIYHRVAPDIYRSSIDVKIIFDPIDCSSPANSLRLFEEQVAAMGLYRLLGACVEGPGAGAVGELGAQHGVQVVAYDAQAAGAGPVLLAGPRAEALGAALAAALAGCGWRRAVLLEEEDEAARATGAALARLAPGPLRRELLPRTEDGLRATLTRLRSEGAAVLVLNARGPAAARVLALAARLEAAPWRAAWLAREWTAPTRPPLTPLLTLRTAPHEATGNETSSPLTGALSAVLGPRDWPARVVAVAEALSTLIYGFQRLFAVREELRYDHRADETLRIFRESLARGSSLPGVARELTFDERGARQPGVRLEVWHPGRAEPEPHSPGSAAACPAPPVSDAPRACHLPVGGDAFAPAACLDALVAVGAPALLLAALLAAYGARALSRRRAARALAWRRRLRAQVGAELLARQPDASAELTALLVERERVTLLRALGAGRHGRVWLAELAPGGVRVAAKAPHAGAAPAEEGELLREAGALAPLRHERVVRLLGVCVGPGPPLLLTAVAAHGDLLGYLRARRPPGGDASEAAHVSAEALTRLAREAALALAYLASRRVVHRDLRAANCLVDERRELKLADFGMARSLNEGKAGAEETEPADGYYRCRRRALFPVLWMAPESLARGAFSPASDVWALGALVLELVSLGARPFGALGAARAVELVKAGGHARLPAGSSAETRTLARACWRREPGARPSARALADWLAAHPAALAPQPHPDPDDEPEDDRDRS